MRGCLPAFFAATVLFSWCIPASAQGSKTSGPETKWEVEVHGSMFLSYHSSGDGVLPAPGETYSTAIVTGVPESTSRRVSSWYFGDGAALFNGAASTVSHPQITPLDSVLTSSAVEPQKWSFGFRASRTIHKWIAGEFNFDRSSELAITSSNLSGIEAARASFAPAWKVAFSPTSSVSSFSGSAGHHTFITGALVIGPARRKFSPYATIGAGILSDTGTNLNATLVGQYASETDTVTVHFAESNNNAFTGVGGGGIRYFLSPHLGIRVDLRAYLYDHPFTTLLDVTPSTVSTATAVVVSAGTGGPAIASRTEVPNIAAYSSLSGPALSGFKSFTGSGMQREIYFTWGLFYRF